MLKKNFVALMVFMMSSATQGLICWICNAGSHAECWRQGHFLECFAPQSQFVCATEVKMNNGRRQIQKQCKQSSACVNEQVQNWASRTSPGRCRPGHTRSTCRCCCFEDFCNRREICRGGSRSFCRPIPTILSGGSMDCSNGNQVGSTCRISCPSRFAEMNIEITPSFSNKITCLPNGKWNHPIPNCRERCPPQIRIDLTVITHRFREEVILERIRGIATNFHRTTNTGADSLRYATFHHHSHVHIPALTFRDSINFTQQDILDFLQNLPYEEDFGPVNTGAALWFAYNNIFGQEGDRPNAVNVLALDTDNNADDDVIEPARALRAAGVVIVPFVHPKPDIRINEQQFNNIAGYRSNWRIGRTDVDDALIGTDLFCRLSYPVLV